MFSYVNKTWARPRQNPAGYDILVRPGGLPHWKDRLIHNQERTMLNMKSLMGTVFMAAGLSGAHLVDGSLVPSGGQSLKTGESVSITWGVSTSHNEGIDIAFSKNSGTTWTNIKTAFVDDAKGTKTFRWTIPSDAVTEKGRFRICQTGPCTDQNVSKPGQNGSPWILVSADFKVAAPTGLATPASDANPYSIDFDPMTRNVDVSFGLDASQAVTLQAFDTHGRLVATLIDGNYAAGSHKLSVFASGLGVSAGSLVFKLKAGDQVRTHTWMSIR
jgi:hypothetical protein